MKTILFFFMMLCLGSLTSIGQTRDSLVHCRIQILDNNTLKPISGIEVYINHTYQIQTDSNGILDFYYPPGHYAMRTMLENGTNILDSLQISSQGIRFKIFMYNKNMLQEMEQIDLNRVTLTSARGNPVNTMLISGSHRLHMEEANRFAGGFDDPGRLATAFAGVQGQTSNNGIVVRGNGPDYLQWRLEGVEIPNPNHFADIVSFGAGGLTALSSQMLDGFDFITGGIPAEYGNVLSGVMDLRIRQGNSSQHKTTLQAGIIGLDAAHEGPLKKPGSSFLANYRYSTLSLLDPILPENARGTRFQNLSWKLFFPTKKGAIWFWGLAGQDRSGKYAVKDSSQWDQTNDPVEYRNLHYFGATGVSMRHQFSSKLSVYHQAAFSGRRIDTRTRLWNGQFNPLDSTSTRHSRPVLQQQWNFQPGTRHLLRWGWGLEWPGFSLTSLQKKMAPYSTLLARAYFQWRWNLRANWTIMSGIGSMWLKNHSHPTFEPRLALVYQQKKSKFNVSYTLSNRMERLAVYRHESLPGIFPNKKFGFTQSQQVSGGWVWKWRSNWELRTEIYHSFLTSIPVRPNSGFSLFNLEDPSDLPDSLADFGKARTKGIELSVEKSLSYQLFGIASLSLFNSTYLGGDSIWRNSRFNRGYIFNLLAGKRWYPAKWNGASLEFSIRYTFQGGQRYTAPDTALSIQFHRYIPLENAYYNLQSPAVHYLHATLSYRRIKGHTQRSWVLSTLNLLGVKEIHQIVYDPQKQSFYFSYLQLIIPNLAWKITF